MKELKEFPGTTMKDLEEFYSQHYPHILGDRFKSFRELMGLSQKEMADKLNLEIENLETIEKGQIDDDIFFPAIFLLMEQYGLNINWIISGKGMVLIKKGPETPEDIYKFFQRLEDPEKAVLILSMIITPVLMDSLIPRVFKVPRLLENYLDEAKKAKESHSNLQGKPQ